MCVQSSNHCSVKQTYINNMGRVLEILEQEKDGRRNWKRKSNKFMVTLFSKNLSANDEKYYNEETKIISVPDPDHPLDPRGIGCAMFDRMKQSLDKVAQVDAATGQEDLYSSYLERSTRTAMKMKSLGITHNDIISICSYNHLDNSVPLVAAWFLGAKVASVDPSLSQDDNTQLLGIVKPKLVFVSPGSEKLIQDAVDTLELNSSIVVFGESEEYLKFDDFSGYQGDIDNFRPRPVDDLDEIALIIFSSGTTGLPKGICCSHRMILFNHFNRKVGITLGFASLYWVSSINLIIIAILGGSSRLICRIFDPKLTWEYFEKYKLSAVFLAPCDAINLMTHAPENTPMFPKRMVIGGSAISWNHILNLRKLLPNTAVHFAYGQSELMTTFNNMNPLTTNKPGCVGLPLPAKRYKIVDPETEQTLGFNQEGELRVKSKYGMTSYYGVKSSDAWDSEGYLKTGDILYYDEDFGFYVVDRIKEMFKYRSWHVVPAKLESILAQHPDVLMGVVIGIPHPEDDFHATGVVTVRDNSTATAADIGRYVNELVDDMHRLRGGVKIVRSLPMTPTSKVKRRELVKMIVKGEI